ncbi:putative glycosyltransferase [Leptospira ryugenii]|uniref:Putative glycosyltransferase n=1 Tax=Leptospira ryugenii TaxID=1917863 RepID=A0A2P2DW45_9LEPT|nr:glycosyltransferase [Leptospira ryugenii]GBF48855.1 putative glycosyltransferase [Leptospira ryugenii]
MNTKEFIKLCLHKITEFIAPIYFYRKALNIGKGLSNAKIIFLLYEIDKKRNESHWKIFFKNIRKFAGFACYEIGSKNYLEFLEQKKTEDLNHFVWFEAKDLIPLLGGFTDEVLCNLPPSIKLIYFDTFNTKHKKPFFKPGPSPEYFEDFDYLEGAFLIPLAEFRNNKEKIQKDLAGYIKSFVSEYSFNQNSVAHIPRIAFSVDRDYHSSQKVLSSQEDKPKSFVKKPLVSILIPFRDRPELLKVAVDSILEKSSYSNYEIILISNQSKEKETLDLIHFYTKNNPNIKKLEYDSIFNFSAINNYAAKQVNGEYLLFLNNDTEVISSHFLEGMLEYASKAKIGLVGPKLLFPDGTIQHAGIILGLTGMAEHAFKFQKDSDEFTAFGFPNSIRNYLSVTAACAMVSKKKFWEVGGFNESLTVCGNDVNLGIKLFEKGYRNVYLPHISLFHFESKSRKNTKIPDGDFIESMKSYKRYLEEGDPYFNQNLDYKFPWLSYNMSSVPAHLRNLERLKRLKPVLFE